MSSKSAYILTVLIILGALLTVIVYFSLNSQGSGSLNESQAFYLKYANKDEMDAVIYSDNDWHPDLIKQLEDGPRYLSKDFELNIAAPPMNSSDEVVSELHELMSLKSQRSKTQLDYIHYENNYGPVLSFVNEGLIDPKTHPITFDLMGQVDVEVVYFTLREKMRFKRARPTQLASGLEAVIPIPPHASYPSGHTAQSYAVAMLLGMLDPKNKQKYIDFALDIGKRREIAGVHYRSDTQASIALAKQVMTGLLENHMFNDLLTLAKSEHSISTSVSTVPQVTYSDSDWDQTLLAQINRGPKILPKDSDVSVYTPQIEDKSFIIQELNSLIALKNERSRDQVERIVFENNNSPLQVFIHEDLLSKTQHPVSIRLLTLISNELEYFVLKESFKTKRARPSQLNENIEPVIDNPKFASYPSLYAAQSFSIHLMLSELDPDHKHVYERLAKDIAYRREIAGVQYRSDTEAGYELAEKLVALLIQQEQVRTLVERAKNEFRASDEHNNN
jgi:acid phosphatase (class A)